MIEIDIDVYGLSKIEKIYRRAPEVIRRRLNNAIKMSVMEILKRTDDGGDSGLFQFRTPRASRTGYIALSFRYGITISDLEASIGPTARYAPRVHRNNPFMKRIAEAAKPDIEKHFADEVNKAILEVGE